MKNHKVFSMRYGSMLMLCGIVIAMSCTKDFDQINTNHNQLSNLQASQLPFLFSMAQSTATNNGWNYQIAQNLFHDQYCQYFANTTTYFPSDRLVMRFDWIYAAWNPMYTQVVPQLQTIKATVDPSSPEYAVALIWEAYMYHRLVDTWGPVPYSQAGMAATGVPYDDPATIYDDLFVKLKTAVTSLQSQASSTPYGSFDLIYGGNAHKWIKFANTLRLRLAIRASGVNGAGVGLTTNIKAEAEDAVASGVLTTSPDDDALIIRSKNGSDFNGLSIMDWNEFRMSAAMESALKGYDDPRTGIYFLPAVQTGTYEGLRNGLTSADMADPLNKADRNSHHGARWSSSTGLETPSNVMCTAEAYFLRAEGVLLGWNMGGGSAQSYYEAGIANSMAQWNITDAAAITAYINNTNTPVAPQDYLHSPPLTDIPVAWGKGSATTIDKMKEQITMQKWLALYPEGVEAWADIRRSNKLKLYPVANSDNPDLPSTPANPTSDHIHRIPFLASEKQTNGAEVDKAVPLLKTGPDKITTHIFWDVNP